MWASLYSPLSITGASKRVKSEETIPNLLVVRLEAVSSFEVAIKMAEPTVDSTRTEITVVEIVRAEVTSLEVLAAILGGEVVVSEAKAIAEVGDITQARDTVGAVAVELQAEVTTEAM